MQQVRRREEGVSALAGFRYAGERGEQKTVLAGAEKLKQSVGRRRGV
jgi:hypothetical protein